MIIYVVPVDDSGDEWAVGGVYSDLAKAKEARKHFKARMDIQVFELDALPDKVPERDLWWEVLIHKDGTIETPLLRNDWKEMLGFGLPAGRRAEDGFICPDNPDSRYFRFFTKDKEDAIIAAECVWEELTQSGKWI